MPLEDPDRLVDILWEAHQRSGSDREAYLHQLAPDMRREVEELLRQYEQDPMERADPTVRVEGYSLIWKLGEGSFGDVYYAWERDPPRKVAIKVLKFSHDTAREDFEREAAVLADLSHQNIVTIYNSGLTESGYAWFSMEYVPGESLDKYVQGRHLNVDQILTLFTKVCNAVAYLQQESVVHRDLKPSNIRVDIRTGEPRVLDFGLAKIADPYHHERSDVLIGTLRYMAPEQVEAHREANPRSDIYTLGVILYELLTDEFPYDVSGSREEVSRNIVSKAPKEPSTLRPELSKDVDVILLTCLNKDGDKRYQSALDLKHDIQAYLEGKPIKERHDDLLYLLRNRLLREHPITGATILLAIIILITTTAGFIYFGWEAIGEAQKERQARTQADEARAEADVARKESDEARDRAEELLALVEVERDRADAERMRALNVRNFINKVIMSGHPHEYLGPNATVSDVVDLVVPEVDGVDDEYIQSGLYVQIGMFYAGVSRYEDAEIYLRQGLAIEEEIYGHESQQVARTMLELATVLRTRGKYDEAAPAFEEALRLLRRHSGEGSVYVAMCLNNYGHLFLNLGDTQRARELYVESLAIYEKDPGDFPQDVATLHDSVGWLDEQQHEYDDARLHYEEGLKIRQRSFSEPHAAIATSLDHLGSIAQKQRRSREAEEYLTAALQMRLASLPEWHLSTAVSYNNLATFMTDVKRDLAKATEYYGQADKILVHVFGETHINRAMVLRSLGRVLWMNEDFAASAKAFEDAFAAAEDLPMNHPIVLRIQWNVAVLLEWEGKFTEAEEEYSIVRKQWSALVSKDPKVYEPLVIGVSYRLATVKVKQGAFDAAQAYWREGVEIAKRRQDERRIAVGGVVEARIRLGEQKIEEAESAVREALDIGALQDLNKALAHEVLADVLVAKRDFAGAEAELRRAVRIRESSQPRTHTALARAKGDLAGCLISQQKYAQAEPLVLESYEIMLDADHISDERKTKALQRGIDCYEGLNNPEEADKFRHRLYSLGQEE